MGSMPSIWHSSFFRTLDFDMATENMGGKLWFVLVAQGSLATDLAAFFHAEVFFGLASRYPFATRFYLRRLKCWGSR